MFSSIVLATFAILLIGSIQCKEEFTRKPRPLTAATFEGIQINGMFDIFLSQLAEGSDAKSSVEIETTAKGHELITVDIDEHKILRITVRETLIIENNESSRLYIKFVGPLRYYSIAGLTQTVIDGEGMVNKKDGLFTLEQQGTANLTMKIDVENFNAAIRGIGKLNFEGQVRNSSNFAIEGAAMVDAGALVSKNVTLQATGASAVRVNSLETLDIFAMGLVSVMYKLPEGKEPRFMNIVGMSSVTRFT